MSAFFVRGFRGFLTGCVISEGSLYVGVWFIVLTIQMNLNTFKILIKTI